MLSNQQKTRPFCSSTLIFLFFKWLLFLCLIFLGSLFSTYSLANSIPSNKATIDLTTKEKAWLAAHPAIRIGVDADYAPYSFRNDDGNYRGIALEFCDYLSGQLGITMEVVQELSWPEIVDGVRERKLDLVVTFAHRPEREAFANFTKIYLPTPLVIMRRRGVTSISSEDDLEGRTVAMVEGYSSSARILEEHPDVKPLMVKTAREGLFAVSTGKANAYVGVLGINLYLTSELGITNLEVASLYGSGKNGQRFGVRKDWPELTTILDKALAAMPAARKREMFERWLPTQTTQFMPTEKSESFIEEQLTPEERDWLTKHSVIRLGNSVDWPPFGFINNEGIYSGIAADYFRVIGNLLKIKIEPAKLNSWQETVEAARKGELDLLDAVIPTPQRREFLTFTKPYISYPVVLFAHDNVDYIASMSALKGQRISVIAGSALHDILKNNHPEVEIVAKENSRAGLLAVKKGEAIVFIGNLPTASLVMSREGITGLKVAGETPYRYNLTIGINKNKLMLASIIQKALGVIPEEKHNEIYRKWMSVTFEHKADYTQFIQLFTVSIFIFILILFWNRQHQLNKLKLEIASRIKTEEKLTNKEVSERAILNTVVDGIITINSNGIIESFNPAAESIFGYKAKEVLGKNINILMPSPYHENHDNYLNQYFLTGKAKIIGFGRELEAKHHDESIFPIEISVSEMRLDGELKFTGVVRDITERKKADDALRKSEQYHRMLFEESTIGLALCQLNGKFVEFNPAYASIIGRTEEEIKTLSYWDITPDKYVEQEKEQFNILEKTGRYGPYEKEYIHADGHLVPVQLSGQILEKDGEKFIWSSVEDITERKQAEIEKEQLQCELQQSQKMEAIGKLTGGIAHEYNNMLAITIGFATLLKDAVVGQPKLINYANEIIHAGDRGAKLTSKLLTFSRKNISEADSLNLNTLLQQQHHMLEKTLTVRIKLILKLQENPWLVWLDSGDMEDVIINMSINAMHAIEGHGQLTIQTSNQKINQMDAKSLNITPGDYVLLSFTDTGSGIDKEIKEKIFEPFFTTKGKFGTGLGLSMVYGFVQNNDGIIKVNSEQGEGTQFTLYFPRYHGTSRVQQSEKENSHEEAFIGNKTILVVDDEPALLTLTREILSSHGFNVLCAESAKDALNILKNESIDILISDVIMPEMDGYELAAIVKEKYPSIKIQLASGFTNDRNTDIVDESLLHNLLHKPFNSQTLLQRIRELCDEN